MKTTELALKGAEPLPNGNWAFRFDPKTRVTLDNPAATAVAIIDFVQPL
jgi:hypothetical protein